MERYDPQQIEAKWQRVWEDERAFHTPNPAPGEEADERHWYQLEMLPYPSGTLHMGHVLNYTMGDVQTHLRRRQGWRVLRPMGFDSFGLPAENAAIKEGGHPREITERYIVVIREQMKRLGWAIDWDREVSAHEVGFYYWTQWLFLRFFERDLAYRKAAPVNWCPNDQTVVANEYVIDGRCWRCGGEVEARNLEQWFFQHHGLRRRAARVRPTRGRVAGPSGRRRFSATGSDARRGRRSCSASTSWTRTCPSSPRGRTRCSARRSSCWRPSIRSSSASTRRRFRRTRSRRRPGAARSGRPRRRRPASSPGSTRSIPSTASGCRSTSPTTC